MFRIPNPEPRIPGKLLGRNDVRRQNGGLLRRAGLVGVDVVTQHRVIRESFEVVLLHLGVRLVSSPPVVGHAIQGGHRTGPVAPSGTCLLYTSDAADERSSVDLGGRRIIKKKKSKK